MASAVQKREPVKWLGLSLVFLLGPACAGDLPVDGQGQRVTEELEAVTVEPGESLADPALPGPCACPDAECIRQWADEQLGCNVCVNLVCPGGNNRHACNHCPG